MANPESQPLPSVGRGGQAGDMAWDTALVLCDHLLVMGLPTCTPYSDPKEKEIKLVSFA